MKGHVDLAHADIPRAVLAEGDVEPRLDGLGAGTGGPFALAVREGRTLVLARDPFGERPLYWCSRGSEIWFASHAQELLELKAPLGQIDRGALSDYLELGYVPSPGSMWSNARKVPPGHLLRFKGSGLPEIEPFAEQPLPGMAAKRPSRIAVRARLEAAVKRALHASRSALLGPSLDSAALVALMTRQAGRIRTFSVGFGDGADLETARRIAHRFRSHHHELRVALKPREDAAQALAACGEPLADAALVLLTAAMREISRESKDLLTSDGASELFGGHDRYLQATRLPQLRRTGRAANLLRLVAPRRHRGRLQRAGVALQSRGASRARAFVELFSADERRALLGSAARVAAHGAAEELAGVESALAFDLVTGLPDSVLFRLDAAAARAGIKARAAFLDPELALAVVPPKARHKIGRTQGNRMLREAVADLLPRDVLALPAGGLEPPLEAWLRGPLRPMVNDLVRAPTARIRTLLDPRAVDAALSHGPKQAWAMLALEVWAREQRG